MNSYLDYLLFVGKCLTLDFHPEKRDEIRNIIRNETISWEKIVFISSNQFVLPAFYIQFERNNLAPDLPADLNEYLNEITNLNRERNKSILGQIRKINQVLNRHDIIPTYLKGTAHLLDGLYTDIGERMIGDIDFLVSEDKMVEVAEILIQEDGYEPMAEYFPEMLKKLKHYPRLRHDKYVSSIEIHKEILNPGHQHLIRGYDVMAGNKPVVIKNTKATVPSIPNMIIHNVLNAQLSDKSILFGDILLRQMYDLLLLAQKENILCVADNFGRCKNVFDSYFATCTFIFSNPVGVSYTKSWRTLLYLKRLKFFMSYKKIWKIYRAVIYLSIRLINYIKKLILFIFHKNTRKLITRNLMDKQWYGKHFNSYRSFFKSSLLTNSSDNIKSSDE